MLSVCCLSLIVACWVVEVDHFGYLQYSTKPLGITLCEHLVRTEFLQVS